MAVSLNERRVGRHGWQKAVEKNLGPSGFKPGAGNPPTPAACGASSGATG